MSNTSSITQWLDHLIDLLPPSAIRLVGAGNGSGIWAQWLAAHGQVAATLVEANPQQFAALQRQQAIGNWGQASLLNTVIAPTAGEVDFFTASLTAESGLLPAEELRAVWPNVHTAATERRAATDLAALLQLDTEPSANQQWLLLDCLPAAALLRSAQAQLQHVDVVVARVLQAGDSIPSLFGMGVSLEDVTKALPGFRLLALQPGRHPALAHALFVRDYRSVVRQVQADLTKITQARDAEAKARQAAQQAQADLQAQLTQLQTEKSELLKKQELQAQAQQALQADLTKITQARDAEASAKQVAQQAQADLQAQLDQARVEKAALLKEKEKAQVELQEKNGQQLLLKKQAEEIEKIKKFMATKGDLNNVAKQLQSFIGLENYWANGELPTVNIEQHAWPVSPDFSLYIVSLLEKNDYDMVVEFGSGISTLVIAKALRKNGNRRTGRQQVVFLSFDHLQKYYEETLEMLQNAGLDEYVQLYYAPLKDWISSDGTIYPYYSCEQILKSFANQYSLSESRILLVVDGPPGNTAPRARYPAVPITLGVFPEAPIDVLLDDAIRKDEKEILNLWQGEFIENKREVELIERKLEKVHFY